MKLKILNEVSISSFKAVFTTVEVAVYVSVFADVISLSYITNATSTDVANCSNAHISLSFNVAVLQTLTLVTSYALDDVIASVTILTAIKIAVLMCILANVISLSDIINPSSTNVANCNN